VLYLLHCNKCHHEWESTTKEDRCSWCGATSYVLEKKKNWVSKILKLVDSRDPRVS
jgi:Zn finger protein HypA/HybF involved in hydrogenase expression